MATKPAIKQLTIFFATRVEKLKCYKECMGSSAPLPRINFAIFERHDQEVKEIYHQDLNLNE
jgi:hypothetical protein